jgi:hypothetical protein
MSLNVFSAYAAIFRSENLARKVACWYVKIGYVCFITKHYIGYLLYIVINIRRLVISNVEETSLNNL